MSPEVTYCEPRITSALIRGRWILMDEPLTHQVLDGLDQDGYTTVEVQDGSGNLGHDTIGGWHRALFQAQGRRTA